MASAQPEAGRGEHLGRLAHIARALDDGASYSARLWWALLFSEEVRAADGRGMPAATVETLRATSLLDREIDSAVEALTSAGAKPELLAALRLGREAEREHRALRWSEISQVYVCRNCGEVIFGQTERCPVCGARAATFREFLPTWYLEPLRPEEALAALATAPGELEELVRGLSEAQMAQPPQPGEWPIRSVLLHVLIPQYLLAERVEKMLSEDNPWLKGVSGNPGGADETLPAREILVRFRVSRQATVERLKALPAQDWYRTGRHEEFGQITLLQQASYMAKHDHYHLRHVEVIRQAVEA